MKTEIKPYTPWSLSFRRWAAKLRPDLQVDRNRHPRTTFATMAENPPYPLPEAEADRPTILHDTGQIPVPEPPNHPVECGASSPTPCREANLLTINENNLAATSC